MIELQPLNDWNFLTNRNANLLELRYAEDKLALSYSWWLISRTPEHEDFKNMYRQDSIDCFDTLVTNMFNDSDYSTTHLGAYLTEVYSGLAKYRRDSLSWLIPDVAPNFILSHHHLQNHFGELLENNSRDKAVSLIKAHYQLELDNCFEYVLAKNDGRNPKYNLLSDYLPKPKSLTEKLNLNKNKAIAAIAIVSAGYLITRDR